MSHVGSSSSTGTRSGRTYWVRRHIAPPPEEGKPSAPKKRKGQRFVQPYRLTEEQRTKLLKPLEEKGIGDPESRDLFAAAMEYDLAGCQALAEPEPPKPRRPAPAKQDPALAALMMTAKALVEQIAGLDAGARSRLLAALKEGDRFKRDYTCDYLAALGAELSRIATAAPAPKRPAPPALSADVRRFILRASDAFADCFEQKATAQRGSPFAAAIKALVAATGIPVPTDGQTLAEILEGKP
jgi:hypothetical protein